MQTLSRGWRWLVLMAGLVLPLALLAQTTPDAQLLLQGNQLLAKKDYPTAVTCYRQVVDKFPASAVRDQALGRLWLCYTELKQPEDAAQALTLLRQGYPRSIVLADLDLQLLTAALTAGQPTMAEPLWKEITTQWPRSTYVWKAADAYARFVMKTDSAKAMTFLDGVLNANLLSLNERTDAQLLRFELLAAANPKQYLTEAVPAIEAGATAKTVADIAFPARLAQQVYLPLMKAGQLDKAKTLSNGLQERLAMLGNPNGLYQADALAFYSALEQVNPAQFIEAALPMAAMVDVVTTPEELDVYIGLLQKLYVPLMKADRVGEAQQLYAQLNEAAMNMKGSKAKGGNDRAYMQGIQNAKPDQALTFFMGEIDKYKDVKDWDTVNLFAQNCVFVYSALGPVGRHEEAEAFHKKIQAIYARFPAPNIDAWRIRDCVQYLKYGGASTEEVIAEGQPILANVGNAKNYEQLYYTAELAQYTMYPTLMALGKVQDARAAHAAIQETARKMGPALLEKDRLAFYDALGKASGKDLLAEALPLIDAAKGAKTADDARMAVMLAKPVYKALMGEGRLDEAKTLHGQVQALIAQVGNPPNWASDDNKAYDGSMSTGTLDIMLSLCAKACIAKDQDTAKKWLAQLNALAPESAQAGKARKLYNTTFEKK